MEGQQLVINRMLGPILSYHTIIWELIILMDSHCNNLATKLADNAA